MVVNASALALEGKGCSELEASLVYVVTVGATQNYIERCFLKNNNHHISNLGAGCTNELSCPGCPEEVVRSPGAGVKSGCKSCDMNSQKHRVICAPNG